MNTWKITLVVAFALVAVSLITASALAFNGVFNPYVNRNGMMGGYGYPANGNYQSTTTYPQTAPGTTPVQVPYQPFDGGGCGCKMRGGWYGSTVPYYTNGVSNATPITIDQAVTVANDYLTRLNNPDLAIGQVEEYTQNFYVSYYEKSTGTGAFEMLIDKYTGNMNPEMGPNMMWNTKYGMMSGGMMGLWRTPTPMTVTVDQAKSAAQQFLNTYYAGTTVGDVTTFYGYYSIEVLYSGNVYGMLSVNGYTGQVWYHTWHGTFIREWTS